MVWGSFITKSFFDILLIEFWNDRWCGEASKQTSFFDIYINMTLKALRINECLSNKEWGWGKILRGSTAMDLGLGVRIRELEDKVSNVTIESRHDDICWR